MKRLVATCGLLALGVLSSGAPAAMAESGGTTPPPFQCNATYSGTTIYNNVEVPAGAVCVLKGSSVHGWVQVDSNAYFESSNSHVFKDVYGSSALTIFVHDASVVDGNVAGYRTPQVMVYGSTVTQNVAAYQGSAPGYGHFQVCGTTLITGNVGASQVGPDILVGDPANGCAGNTLQQGNIALTQNNTYQELTVRGNTLQAGGVSVTNNAGTSPKAVQGNSGPNGTLQCQGNATPFAGSPNGQFAKYSGGQCS